MAHLKIDKALFCPPLQDGPGVGGKFGLSVNGHSVKFINNC